MKKYWKYIFAGGLLLFAITFRFILLPRIDLGAHIGTLSEPEPEAVVFSVAEDYMRVKFDEGAAVADQSDRGLHFGVVQVTESLLNHSYNSDDYSGSTARVNTLNSTEAYAGKELNYAGSAERVFLLKEASSEVSLPDATKLFDGYKGYYVNLQDSSELELQTDERFIIDYDISRDGQVLGTLEAKVKSATLLSGQVCSNCTDLLFEVWFVNYDYSTGEIIDQIYIRDLSVLVNPKSPTTFDEIGSINLNASNIYTVNFSNPSYAPLHGNDLLNISLDLSDDGKSFIYKYFDVYSRSESEDILVADLSELASRYSDGESFEYEGGWLPGGRYLLGIESDTGEYFINIVNVADGSSNVLKSPIMIEEGWAVGRDMLLVQASSLTSSEVSLLDQYLNFEERMIYLSSISEILDATAFELLSYSSEHESFVIEAEGQFFYYDIDSEILYPIEVVE